MPAHGYGAYTHGCRCAICRDAKAAYMSRRRAEGRALAQKHTSGLPGKVGSVRHLAAHVKHGTRYAYEEKGCRCLDCTTARSRSDRRYRRS